MADNAGGINNLAPARRFLYEYGCFLLFWGNFEFVLEVVCLLVDKPDVDSWTKEEVRANCHNINGKTAGVKKAELLKRICKSQLDYRVLQEALENVFQVAERNDWIHCTILNPLGDFSVLTRLRVTPDPFHVEIKEIVSESAITNFEWFYPAYAEFGDAILSTFGRDLKEVGSYYIGKLQDSPYILSSP